MEPSSTTTTCAPTCEGPAVGIKSPGPRISKSSTTTANHQQIIGPSSFITSLSPEAEIFEQPHKQKCLSSGQISSSTASPTRIRKRRSFDPSEKEFIQPTRRIGACAICKHFKTKCTHPFPWTNPRPAESPCYSVDSGYGSRFSPESEEVTTPHDALKSPLLGFPSFEYPPLDLDDMFKFTDSRILAEPDITRSDDNGTHKPLSLMLGPSLYSDVLTYDQTNNYSPQIPMPSHSNSSCAASNETESDSVEDLSLEDSSRLTILYNKHLLVTSLMQEIYALFDQRWSQTLRSHGNTSADRSTPCDIDGSFSSGDAQRTRKRKCDGRDSTPPEDHDDKKRPRKKLSLAAENSSRLFACPLHQNNTTKYCASIIDGSKFRACGGPGFATVSRLKQHLKRVHRAPTQCTRCWRILPNMQAMSSHANEEVRCEARDPRPEGIFSDKMELITSKHGATWADIYSIIFPGAPIPSAYYEYQGLETYTGKSPRSQNLEDFETYSRTELPRLVEANLQVMVDAQIAPLEESLKALLVDLVRRCQSTVAQNYGRINPTIPADGGAELPKATTPTLVDQTPTTSAKATLAQSADGKSTTNEPQHDGPYFFEEPPLLTGNEADAIAALFPSLPHNDAFDSGYGSQRACTCVFDEPDYNLDFWGKSICSRCGLEHDSLRNIEV